MRRGYFKIIREFEKPQLAQTTYRPLNILESDIKMGFSKI